MLKNTKKLAISKQLLISLVFIALMFTAFGVSTENLYAIEVNETVDEMGVELDIEDKLENSQNYEMLQATKTLNGGTFSDIQKAIDAASSGDTIKLSGTFVAKSKDDLISVNKKLVITSSSSATLDGKKLTNIFAVRSTGEGSKISNLIFQNGYSTNEGGAIRITGKSVTIDNCVFKNNNAKISSGAIHTSYSPKVAENLVIKNCKFTGNSAGAAAGAAGVFGYNFKITNCVFDSNKVEYEKNSYGGAIQVGLDTGLSKGTVSGCNFTNNKAISKSGISHGGAGCLRNGTSYKNCIFKGNSADHGGAITFHASATLDSCKFYNNKATKYGGALSISLEQKTMDLTINKCVFDKNTAPLGGAAKLDGMNIKIQNSNFTSNTATKYGGAVDIDAKNVNILSSNFKDNTANVNGGGIYINGVKTVVSKSIFTGNDAIPDVKKLNDGLGGAIYVNSTQATINDNIFKLNTARNGSAVYYDASGKKLNLSDNEMYQNQAWSYLLPVNAYDIYYGDVETLTSVLYGGNNIAKYNDLSVSNAIYNAAKNSNIVVDGETPVNGATKTGELYQDGREYRMKISLTVTHEDGSVAYDGILLSSYLGKVTKYLNDLKPGVYTVKAKHEEDTYYKSISNTTTFKVIPKVDNQILKVAYGNENAAGDDEKFDYKDLVVWTLNITNNGPNNATEVVVNDILPDGLVYVRDDSGGKYDAATGKLIIGNLTVGKSIIVNIITMVNKTGFINNEANVTANEYDYNLTNNKDNASINVNPAIDLSVVKSVNNTNPNYHDLITWTLTVKNNGPDVAHDVKVFDKLPSSLIFQSAPSAYNSLTGYWNVGTLNVGSVARLNIVCKVNKTGAIRNDVSVSGREKDHDLTNNNDSKIIIVNPASDLAIEKSVNVTNANYNDLVKWTLTIRNNGPDDATGVKVYDAMPKGFTPVEVKLPKGNYLNGLINIGNLAVGEKLTLEILCKVSATGNFTNIANITGNEYDHDMTNNEDNASILINPAADLQVTKDVNNSNPNYPGLITWTITVKNNGPDLAHDVKVKDTIPKSLIWKNDDSHGKYNPQTAIWDIGQLASGSSVSLKIICQINATGNTTNYVSVTGREYDYDLTNNYDNETIHVVKAADVAIEKFVNNTSPNYNDLVKWTVRITNNGPDKATDVFIEEKIPEGLVLVNYTATKGIFADGAWVMCCLNQSEVQTLELVCRVNKTGKITNLVVISANEHDYNPDNNKSNKSIDVPPAVDLELTKEVNDTTPYFGDTVLWTINLKNNGPDRATGVVVSDLLPDSLLYVDYESDKGEFHEGIWNVGSLNVGESAYLKIIAIVDAIGEITNYAEATSNEYDWNMFNNYDSAELEVSPVADLAIEKLVNNTSPNYNSLVKWTLIVTNNGPNDASNVVVYDEIPEGLTLISSSGNYRDGIWNIGYLDAGDSVQLDLVCKVTATGEFVNSATVSGDEYDPDLSNNDDDKTIVVPPASDISITKIATKYQYKVGDVVRYAIELVNNGPDRAENIVVDEILEKSLTLKSFKASAGDFDKVTKKWDVGSLEFGESASLEVTATANKKGMAKNTVKAVSDTYDPDLSNNEDFAAVNVTDDSVKRPESPNISKNIAKNEYSNEISNNILEKNVSGNSILVLLISMIFSAIFVGSDISKKR